ncbi:MAG: DinB family protein [Candidatus Kapabacteria bacterium]|nr:DinB family protein [Candidatus Kapabacteria bacterium]
MSADYKQKLHTIIEAKKKEMPSQGSVNAILSIMATLQETPRYLRSVAPRFPEERSRVPIMEGKRSFRQTVEHLLNIEALHYTTIYPAFLLPTPDVYPLHAERHIARLQLFDSFTMEELLTVFEFERRKSLSFLESLTAGDWLRTIREQGKKRQESIYWRARTLALHDVTHVHIIMFQLAAK